MFEIFSPGDNISVVMNGTKQPTNVVFFCGKQIREARKYWIIDPERFIIELDNNNYMQSYFCEKCGNYGLTYADSYIHNSARCKCF